MSSSSSLLPVPGAASRLVTPLIQRANELQKVEPIISYYCQLHAAQQILNKGLHLSDSAVSEYASNLLDSVETFKSNATADQQAIISDEVTGQAYVEQFANKVLARGEADLNNRKCSRATSSTFYAASIFLDVLRVFHDVDTEELNAKIKFAKFHAARIVKALQAGEDPNEGIPDREQTLSPMDVDRMSVSPSAEQPPAETASTNLDTTSPDPSIPDVESAMVSSVSSSSLPRSIPHALPSPSPPATFVQPETSHPPLTKSSVSELMSQAEIITNAQKHAKYAVSALNYDDIPTAMAELRKSLELLESYK